MLPELLQSTKLFHLLHRIDIDLAAQQQKAGCPFCGGSLHYSNSQPYNLVFVTKRANIHKEELIIPTGAIQ